MVPRTRHCDGRWKPFDAIAIGLVQPLEELPRVGGETFDITTLAFGVEGIEGKRCFAASGHAANDHKLVPGNIDVHRFEIMHAHTPQPDRSRASVCVPDDCLGG